MRYKTALITGAARGIGLATAQLMTAKGYRVAMVDRDVDELNTVVTNLDPVSYTHLTLPTKA